MRIGLLTEGGYPYADGGGADGLIGEAARFRVSGDDDTAVVIVQVEGER